MLDYFVVFGSLDNLLPNLVNEFGVVFFKLREKSSIYLVKVDISVSGSWTYLIWMRLWYHRLLLNIFFLVTGFFRVNVNLTLDWLVSDRSLPTVNVHKHSFVRLKDISSLIWLYRQVCVRYRLSKRLNILLDWIFRLFCCKSAFRFTQIDETFHRFAAVAQLVNKSMFLVFNVINYLFSNRFVVNHLVVTLTLHYFSLSFFLFFLWGSFSL